MDKSDFVTYVLVISGLLSLLEVFGFALWKLWDIYNSYGLTWVGISLFFPALTIISLIVALKT